MKAFSMKAFPIILVVVISGFAGCITAVSPEKAASVDLNKTGLVLASLTRTGSPSDVKRVSVEFYLRPTVGHGDFLKELVINDSNDLWLIEVPLGRYRINDWLLAAGPVRRESAERGYEFDVLPGEITYIGHFEVAVTRAKNMLGMRVIPQAIPALKDDYASTLVAFRRRFPRLSSTVVRNAAPSQFSWGMTDSRMVPIYIPVSVTK
jgi:hypothetical protein